MYKLLNEVQEVISLGKPIEIVDLFLYSYLQGVEFGKWAEGKDLDAMVDVVVGQDIDGNDIIESHFVNIYNPIDVAAQAAQWKLDNYRVLRRAYYPPMSDYLDAVVKNDAVAQQAYIDACLAVKAKYPK